ncbi:MAG: AAA family ATPase [Bacteriovoracia bacterium]
MKSQVSSFLAISGLMLFSATLAQAAKGTAPSYHYFALPEDEATLLQARLRKDGYKATIKPGLYYQDQTSLTLERGNGGIVAQYNVASCVIDNPDQPGTLTRDVKIAGPGEPKPAIPQVAQNSGNGSYQIGFVSIQVGNPNALPWVLRQNAKLRFEIDEKRLILPGTPPSAGDLYPIAGGVLVTRKVNGQKILTYASNDGKQVKDFPVTPFSQIVTSDVSSSGFYFVGQSPQSKRAALYYATQEGALTELAPANFDLSQLAMRVSIIREGIFFLEGDLSESASQKLSFLKYDTRTQSVRVSFSRPGNASKKFSIINNQATVQNRNANGQWERYLVLYDGSELETANYSLRNRLSDEDHKVLREHKFTDYTQRAELGESMNVVHRPEYSQALLGNLVYGSTGWINIVAPRGVNAADVVQDLANQLAWANKLTLPREIESFKLIGIPPEKIQSTWEAGIKIENARASAGPNDAAKTAPNPWGELRKVFWRKRAALVIDNFLKQQGNMGASEQLTLLMGAFNSLANGNDVSDLESRSMLIVTITEDKHWEQAKKNNPVLDTLARTIYVQPPQGDVLRAIVRSQLYQIQMRHAVQFRDDVLARVFEMSAQFHPELAEPERTLTTLAEIGAYARTQQAAVSGNQPTLVNTEVLGQFAEATYQVKLISHDDDSFKAAMHQRIVGHDRAIERLAQAASMIRTRMYDKTRGYGTFLFIGPKGVGKTESARALADVLKFPLYTINLAAGPSQLISSKDAAKLKEMGSKPRIVLFDEIDKAEPDVIKALHPILEEGRYPLSGENDDDYLDFRSTLVILTANYAAKDIQAISLESGMAEVNADNEALFIDRIAQGGLVRTNEENLERGQIPDFIWSRISSKVCIFTPFTEDQGLGVLALQLKRLETRLKDNWNRPVKIHLSRGYALKVVRQGMAASDKNRNANAGNGHTIKNTLDNEVFTKVAEKFNQIQETLTEDSLADLHDFYIVLMPNGKLEVITNLEDPEIQKQLDRKNLITSDFVAGGEK